jgi:hypothetical protein
MKPTNGSWKPPKMPDPAPAAGRDAKRLAAVILEVLAGLRTPAQAAVASNVSVPRYYQLEARAMVALVAACEPQPKGRRRGPLQEVVALQKDNERLKREVGRQQALVRLAQRSIGITAPPPVPTSKARRQRTARALVAARRLRESADQADGTHVVMELQ